MDFLVKLAEGFTGIFNAGGENLIGLITGILPNLLVLLTFVNSLVVLIGEKRVSHFTQKLTRFTILRTTLLPFCSLFLLSNPMCFTMGRFLDEDQKPAFIDTIGSMAHPLTGIFPHAN
ncbi:MAG: PTS glucitol/sorbitol transporter subunit IIC, partial [Enterococcus hulanensis]